MNKIFHIPHSSTYITKGYINDYSVNLDYLNLSASIICDNEILWDSVFRINIYISFVMYILPLFSMYEGFVKLIEKSKIILN